MPTTRSSKTAGQPLSIRTRSALRCLWSVSWASRLTQTRCLMFRSSDYMSTSDKHSISSVLFTYVLHILGRRDGFYTFCAEVLVDQEHDPRGAQESRKKGGVLCWKSRPWMCVPFFFVYLVAVC